MGRGTRRGGGQPQLREQSGSRIDRRGRVRQRRSAWHGARGRRRELGQLQRRRQHGGLSSQIRFGDRGGRDRLRRPTTLFLELGPGRRARGAGRFDLFHPPRRRVWLAQRHVNGVAARGRRGGPDRPGRHCRQQRQRSYQRRGSREPDCDEPGSRRRRARQSLRFRAGGCGRRGGCGRTSRAGRHRRFDDRPAHLRKRNGHHRHGRGGRDR